MAAPNNEIDSDEEMEVIAAATAIIVEECQPTRLWTKDWILQRPNLGAYATLLLLLLRSPMVSLRG